MKKNFKLYLFTNFPKLMLRIYFYRLFNQRLSFKNPMMFSEKIQWLKLYYANDPNVLLAGDKVGMHQYLKSKNLDFLSVPVYGDYKSVNDLNWAELPQKFVMKKSNSSGMNIIVTDKNKADEEKTLLQMNKWMSEDFGVFGAELHYGNMDSKIVVEEFLENISKDWRIFFLNGKPKMIQVSYWDESDEDNYKGHIGSVKVCTDMEGNIIHTMVDGSSDQNSLNTLNSDKIELPADLNKMIEYGKILSEDFPLVRVDYFHSDDKLYLSELTFTPANGFNPYNEKIQRELGQALELPEKRN